MHLNDFFSSVSGTHPTDPAYLNWTFPIGAVVIYVVGKFVLQAICKQLKTTGTSIPFQGFVILHNSKIQKRKKKTKDFCF